MLTAEQLAELKQTTPAFRSTPTALEDLLVRHGEYLTVTAGTRLFAEGDPCEALLMITRGSVRAVKISEDGREILLYRINPGEFCVLSVGCLTADKPYPSDGVCDTEVSGIRLPAEVFHRLSQEHPEFRQHVVDLMGARLADVMELVEAVAFHRLDRRLASLLIEKSASNSKTAEPLTVTHNELAKDLGSSREIISRVLESFEAEGLVELGRKRIEIRDAEGLSQISSAGA
jgi:CRP/FNR family transcriptional regulator